MTSQDGTGNSRSAPLEPAHREKELRVLAIVEDADKPTIATLCGLQDSGCAVSVIAPENADVRRELIGGGVRLLDFTIRKRLDIAGIGQLRRELIAGEYDILHTFNNRGLQNGIIALRGLPTRLIAYRGRVGNISFFDPFCWLRHLNPRVERVVCVSDAVRDYFLKMRPAGLRAREDKFVRIHKGHDLDWYRDDRSDLSQFGIPEAAFVVSCVANYRPHKGIDDLVKSLRHLPRDWPVHLLLIGNMSAPQLDQLIASVPDPERVHRIGFRRDAPAIAAAADVAVLPSTIPEGLPRSIIEAMAYERACIVTNLGGSAELVVDGESGLHVQPGNPESIAGAIGRLYSDPQLRETLGRNARRRIGEAFNIRQTVASTLELYQNVTRRAA